MTSMEMICIKFEKLRQQRNSAARRWYHSNSQQVLEKLARKRAEKKATEAKMFYLSQTRDFLHDS